MDRSFVRFFPFFPACKFRSPTISPERFYRFGTVAKVSFIFNRFCSVSGKKFEEAWFANVAGKSSSGHGSLQEQDLLMLVGWGEILGAWRSSVTRICAVQRVLSEKSAVIFVYSTRSESGTFRQLHPGLVFRFHVTLHRRRWPFQVSPHVSTNWSLCRGRLCLVNWRWCLKFVTRTFKN